MTAPGSGVKPTTAATQAYTPPAPATMTSSRRPATAPPAPTILTEPPPPPTQPPVTQRQVTQPPVPRRPVVIYPPRRRPGRRRPAGRVPSACNGYQCPSLANTRRVGQWVRRCGKSWKQQSKEVDEVCRKARESKMTMPEKCIVTYSLTDLPLRILTGNLYFFEL